MPDFHFLSSASVLASHYSASVLPFPLSSRFCLTGGLSGAPVLLSLPRLSPYFGLVSRTLFQVLCTRLSVSFLSPYLASLPQLFHKCLLGSVPLSVHFALAFRPSLSAFFRPLLFRVRLLSLPFLLFPSSPSCLTVAFQVLIYPRSLPSVSILPFPLWYSAFPAFPFSAHCFASQVLLQLPASCFQLGRSP